MEYLLMHKDIPVALIDLDVNLGTIFKVLHVYSSEHYPYGVPLYDYVKLNTWFNLRAIPASRDNLKRLLERTGEYSSASLSVKNYSLSLTDHYWVKLPNQTVKWEEINYFDNDFSEDIGNMLFGNKIKDYPLNIKSPDCTTDGALSKRWKILNGKRVLVKSGSSFTRQEVFNEVIASELMYRLDIPHVEYSLLYEGNKPRCASEDFITRDTEYIGAWYFLGMPDDLTMDNFYERYSSRCKDLHLESALIQFDQMLLVDYLLLNCDRHLTNFGFIRDANTLEIISAAPIFDTGSSLGCNLTFSDLQFDDICELQPLKITPDMQLEAIRSFSWLDANKLNNFDIFIRNTLAKMPDKLHPERIDLIVNNFLNRRNKLIGLVSKVILASELSSFHQMKVMRILQSLGIEDLESWMKLHTADEALRLLEGD